MIVQEAWQPPLHPKGAEIVNDQHRYTLVTGPKKSAKTISICHKVARHLYDYNHSHVGIMVKRQENARIGVWQDLTDFCIGQHWQGTAGVLNYHLRPRITETKRRVFSIYNRAGGISHCTLVTVYRESEIEQMLKNTRFSMIYINEADQFPETIFSASADQLRMESLGIPTEAHQMVLDCNPPLEGERHWLYKRFIDSTNQDSEWFKNFRVIKTFIADNPWLSQREINDLISRYKMNPRMYARYVDGIWVPSSEGSLFEHVFKEEIHVVGERIPGRPQETWPILLPPRHTNQIVVGWDLGDINHSVVLISKRWHPDGFYCYDILEDITSMARELSIRQFTTRRVMPRLQFWKDVLMRREAELVSFKHWSDPSAFIHKSTGGRDSNTHALEVKNASKGTIDLRAVRKGPGSVAARVSMMESLLMDGRLSISILAENLINAMIGLKPGPKGIARAPMLIHAFDAATYGLSGEIGRDLEEEGQEGEEEHTVRHSGW
jgi:hypothetical protein